MWLVALGRIESVPLYGALVWRPRRFGPPSIYFRFFPLTHPLFSPPRNSRPFSTWLCVMINNIHWNFSWHTKKKKTNVSGPRISFSCVQCRCVHRSNLLFSLFGGIIHPKFDSDGLQILKTLHLNKTILLLWIAVWQCLNELQTINATIKSVTICIVNTICEKCNINY